jgi:hypothetical protein
LGVVEEAATETEAAASTARRRRPPGPLFRALRRRGVHPDVLAAQCGVSVGLVYSWDRGSRPPPHRHAGTIAALVGVDEAREVYEATGPAPGSGHLPTAQSRRRCYRATARDLRLRGFAALAAEVEARMVAEDEDGPRSAAA